jgi:hypothetical protein
MRTNFLKLFKCHIYFSSILFVGKKKLKKGSNLGPLCWRGDFNHYITFFSLKLLCKKYTYNINHYASIVKKNSCWALYSKCIESDATFNLLLLFNVCQLAYPFPNKETWKSAFSYLCLCKIFFFHTIFISKFSYLFHKFAFHFSLIELIQIQFKLHAMSFNIFIQMEFNFSKKYSFLSSTN